MADVAVVEAHDAKSAGGQSLAERIRPCDQLHAESHDQQDRWCRSVASFLVLDGYSVRPNCRHGLLLAGNPHAMVAGTDALRFVNHSSNRCTTTKKHGTNTTARQVEASIPVDTEIPID